MKYTYDCGGANAESFNDGQFGAKLHDLEPTLDGLVSQQRFEKFAFAGKASVNRGLADMRMTRDAIKSESFEAMVPQDLPTGFKNSRGKTLRFLQRRTTALRGGPTTRKISGR